MSEPKTNKEIFSWWIERGFALLPVQPNSKFLLAGFGEHQKKITMMREAENFFTPRKNLNLAVCGHDGIIMLDFDDLKLYGEWASSHAEIANTYTEITPRPGRRVFYFGSAPGGLRIKPGVEIKRVALVAPSIVAGIAYQRGNGEIIEAKPETVFSSLSVVGSRSAYVLIAEHRAERAAAEREASRSREGLISKIKNYYPVLKVFSVYKPDLKFTIRGNVAVARCPFHDDKKPSLFVLVDRGYWKCSACGEHGDAINLYARFEGIDNREAVARMTKTLPRGE